MKFIRSLKRLVIFIILMFYLSSNLYNASNTSINIPMNKCNNTHYLRPELLFEASGENLLNLIIQGDGDYGLLTKKIDTSFCDFLHDPKFKDKDMLDIMLSFNLVKFKMDSGYLVYTVKRIDDNTFEFIGSMGFVPIRMRMNMEDLGDLEVMRNTIALQIALCINDLETVRHLVLEKEVNVRALDHEGDSIFSSLYKVIDVRMLARILVDNFNGSLVSHMIEKENEKLGLTIDSYDEQLESLTMDPFIDDDKKELLKMNLASEWIILNMKQNNYSEVKKILSNICRILLSRKFYRFINEKGLISIYGSCLEQLIAVAKELRGISFLVDDSDFYDKIIRELKCLQVAYISVLRIRNLVIQAVGIEEYIIYQKKYKRNLIFNFLVYEDMFDLEGAKNYNEQLNLLQRAKEMAGIMKSQILQTEIEHCRQVVLEKKSERWIQLFANIEVEYITAYLEQYPEDVYFVFKEIVTGQGVGFDVREVIVYLMQNYKDNIKQGIKRDINSDFLQRRGIVWNDVREGVDPVNINLNITDDQEFVIRQFVLLNETSLEDLALFYILLDFMRSLRFLSDEDVADLCGVTSMAFRKIVRLRQLNKKNKTLGFYDIKQIEDDFKYIIENYNSLFNKDFELEEFLDKFELNELYKKWMFIVVKCNEMELVKDYCDLNLGFSDKRVLYNLMEVVNFIEIKHRVLGLNYLDLKQKILTWILDNFESIDRKMGEHVKRGAIQVDDRIVLFDGQEVIRNESGEISISEALVPLELSEMLLVRYGVTELRVSEMDVYSDDDSIFDSQLDMSSDLLLNIINKVFKRNLPLVPRFGAYLLNAA